MRRVVRVGLIALAAIQWITGLWMQYLPGSFYRDFPTVSLTPPFSEHLMRDFGGASIGLAVVVTAAAIWMDSRLVVVALVAYLAYSVPHLAFHLSHLHDATPADVTFIVLSLGGSVVLPATVLALALLDARRRRPPGPSRGPAPDPAFRKLRT